MKNKYSSKYSDLQVVETGNLFGTMNAGTMPKDLTKEEKNARMLENHRKAGEAIGFDGNHMYMVDQHDKCGTYFKITEEFVKENPYGWLKTDIREDIAIIDKDLPNVVIGHPVADCPVVIMEDIKKGVCAVAHCSAELIDKKMPEMVADALLDAYESKDEDIVAYITACAGPSWTYDSYPNWATDKEMWKQGITFGSDDKFHINLRKVIVSQLLERNIGKFNFNLDDTITNKNYYSNNAASPYGLNDQSKYGRNFAGAYYKTR